MILIQLTRIFCFFLLIQIITSYYYSYFQNQEKFYTYDAQITQVLVNKQGTKLILHVDQNIPFLSHYQSNQVTSTFIINLQCINPTTFKVSITDAINQIFHLYENYPYPNFNNLDNLHIDKNPQYDRLSSNSHFLKFCGINVQFNQFSSYIEILIQQLQTGVLVKLLGFAVQKKFTFFHTYLRTEYLLGLGQRNGKLKIKKGNYTLWSKDNLFAIQKQQPCKNTYSYHPIIFFRDQKVQNYGLLYFRTTNALQFQILDQVNIQKQETLKLLRSQIHSNSIEIIFFSDRNPKQLIKKYHKYIGGFIIQPLWAFGFHQSRWGYKNIQKLEEVADGYSKNNMKLQSIFLDIDYMKNKKPLQIDEKSFPEKQLSELKQKYNIKIVPIVDFAFNYDFPQKVKGKKQFSATNSNIKNLLKLFLQNSEGKKYIGYVWPGHSIFPDFFHPKIKIFWQQYLLYLQKKIPFDAIWLDMNEPANFIQQIEQTQFYYDVNLNCGEHLSNMTIPISSLHYNDIPQFYLHNLNGIKQQQITYQIAQQKFAEDFFMISRNTFPGSGKFSGHWSGDNLIQSQFLGYSLSSLLNFNLFGIPFTGSDMCGFYGDAEQQLCAKWIQSNTLFPFFRNHNHIEAIDQQFYDFGERVKLSFIRSMNLRYSLLKYIYNIFIQSQGIGMIYSPLFFQFPQDFQKLSDDNIIQNQAMIGKDIFFSIIQKVYFPKNVSWFFYREGKLILHKSQKVRTYLINSLVDDQLKLFVRDGALILEQNASLITKVNELDDKFIVRCYLQSFDSCQLNYYDQKGSKILRKNKNVLQEWQFELSIKVIGLQVNQIKQIHIKIKQKSGNKKFIFKIQKIIIYTGANLIRVNQSCSKRVIQAGNSTYNTRNCNYKIKIQENKIQISKSKLRIATDRSEHLQF